MTNISGNWRINANGSQGFLILESQDNVSFTGSIRLDETAERGDAIQGTWNDAGRTINFNRPLPDGSTQFYTGFLGDNHAENLILAGTITDTVNPGTFAGWVASPLQESATYVLSIDNLHCNQTRDTISLPEFTGRDTDYGALVTQVLTQVGYGEVLDQKQSIGSVHHGEDHALDLQLTVRLQANESLTFSYLFINSGFQGSGAQETGQFLDKLSGAVRDALNVAYPAEKVIWEALNDLTLGLNQLQFSGCDGIVAGDKITFTAAELDQLMPVAGARHVETREYNRYDHQLPCQTPDYTVTWSFTRQ